MAAAAGWQEITRRRLTSSISTRSGTSPRAVPQPEPRKVDQGRCPGRRAVTRNAEVTQIQQPRHRGAVPGEQIESGCVVLATRPSSSRPPTSATRNRACGCCPQTVETKQASRLVRWPIHVRRRACPTAPRIARHGVAARYVTRSVRPFMRRGPYSSGKSRYRSMSSTRAPRRRRRLTDVTQSTAASPIRFCWPSAVDAVEPEVGRELRGGRLILDPAKSSAVLFQVAHRRAVTARAPRPHAPSINRRGAINTPSHALHRRARRVAGIHAGRSMGSQRRALM